MTAIVTFKDDPSRPNGVNVTMRFPKPLDPKAPATAALHMAAACMAEALKLGKKKGGAK